MSLEIFEKVKNFLVRIVKDEDFRAQLMSEKAEEVKKAIEDGGYKFSQAEFETAAIKILELKESGEFDELSEEELVGAFGGLTTITIYWPPEGYPKPWRKPKPWAQPAYGIVIGPIDPPVQAMYGVIVADQILKDPSPKEFSQPLYGVIVPPEI